MMISWSFSVIIFCCFECLSDGTRFLKAPPWWIFLKSFFGRMNQLMKKILTGLMCSGNHLPLKGFTWLLNFKRKPNPADAGPEDKWRIHLFYLNSWSLQHTRTTQVPFVSPSCFSLNLPAVRRNSCRLSLQCYIPQVDLIHSPVTPLPVWVQIRAGWQAFSMKMNASFPFGITERVPWAGCTDNCQQP